MNTVPGVLLSAAGRAMMQSWLWVGPSCRYVPAKAPVQEPMLRMQLALTVPQHCSDAADTGQCGQAQLQAVHMQAGTCWKHLPCSYLAAQQMHASLSAASWAASDKRQYMRDSWARL